MNVLNINEIKNVSGGDQIFCALYPLTGELLCNYLDWNGIPYGEVYSIPYYVIDGNIGFFI